MKMETNGAGCKKLLKKDYFRKAEMQFPD